MPPLVLNPTDPRLSWLGCISLETTADGHVIPWRLPHRELALFPPHGDGASSAPAAELVSGIRIVFLSDTRSIEIHQAAPAAPHPLDICCNGRLVASLAANADGWFRCHDLPPGEKRLELWLPHGARFELRELRLSSRAGLRRAPDGRRRWLACGGSFTHAASATSPAQTWPGIVARTHDVNLTNLGFATPGHLDPMIARLVRDQSVDALSICVGPDRPECPGHPGALRATLIGFVRIVREKHPDIPVALITPPLYPGHDTRVTTTGWTLPLLCDEVAAAVQALQNHGDQNIFYLHGPALLDADDESGQFAARFNELVAPRLFNATGQLPPVESDATKIGIADIGMLAMEA